MNKKILIMLGIVVLLVLGVTFPRGKAVVERITEVGAVASPDIDSPYLKVNGVPTWYVSQTMKQATSTLCSFKTPSATTTIESLTAVFSTTASYATSYAIGNDSTAYATTTIIVAPYSFGANARGEIVASTTKITAFTQNGAVSPNTYINLKLSTTTASATYAPVGSCKVVFREL